MNPPNVETMNPPNVETDEKTTLDEKTVDEKTVDEKTVDGKTVEEQFRARHSTPPPEPPQASPGPTKPKIERKEIVRRVLIGLGAFALVMIVVLAIAYFRLAGWVDKQLAAGPFQHSHDFYAAPESIAAGDRVSPTEVIAALHRAGLREGSANEPNTFAVTQNGLILRTSTGVRIGFSGNEVGSITDLATNKPLAEFQLPPQLITNYSDDGRAKRIMIHFSDLPRVLVEAVVSAEDKRFFKHGGLDVLRIAKAVYIDLRQHRKEQGASTITMQLARNLWLDQDKSWKRKIAESLITVHLEHKLSKQQIMEYYVNTVFLGGRGTFNITGFGEAAHAYFNKDVSKLNLTEAATLAGLIQRPSFDNPLRHPDRALDRRNVVLSLMRENGYITSGEYEQAIRTPLGLQPGISNMSGTQYALDAATDQLQHHINEDAGGGVSVYTTIDLRLQRAAEDALRDGMELVDKQLYGGKKSRPTGAAPQAALIAIDPHTGEIKAMVGGRDYVSSQLNRIFAKRPPGSVFKPFVYTAAISSAIDGGQVVFTPASTVMDAATTFQNGNQTYTPANFKDRFMGQVTLRRALANSLNNATVRVAEQVGYDKIVALARRAGFNENIQPTPAVALGAYAVTPLEVAGAYTIFANGGLRVTPKLIATVRNQDGIALYNNDPETYRALDPRVAFIMTDMLEEVLRSGTGAGVRARGFNLPAAGKTGTSHDGWFAGYTSQLLCVVWVGFDDYRELGLEGARSALPIWTEFMMNAARYKEYRDAKPFSPPDGVVKAAVDSASGRLAGPYCPGNEVDYFIQGTEPEGTCTPPEPEHEFFPPIANQVGRLHRMFQWFSR